MVEKIGLNLIVRTTNNHADMFQLHARIGT